MRVVQRFSVVSLFLRKVFISLSFAILFCTFSGLFGLSPTYASGGLHISSVSPNSGYTGGGTAVQVLGSGFTSDVHLSFGGTKAAIFGITQNALYAITPAHKSGRVTVKVQNALRQSASLR